MRMPDLSRRTVLAAIAIVVGLVVIGVAAFGGSGSSNGGSGSDAQRSVKPVAPIDPDDKDAAKPREAEPMPDVKDPFATSYGAKAKHKVTIRVTGNGYVNIAVYYRDRDGRKVLVAPGHTETRTINGRYPLSAVAIQLPGALPGGASVATCTIVVDGIEVAKKTSRKKGVLKYCVG